jgi:HEAT repeat protein
MPAGPEAEGLAHGRASELIGLLAKGIRARQTYSPNNPVYQKFMGALRSAFAAAFEQTSELRIAVEESAFRIGEESVTVGEGRDSLAFFFYKDGIRRLEFLPGFEAELELFLDLLHQAKQAGPEGEDLVTLLWEHEFEAFNYSYVDLLAEGVRVPDPAQVQLPLIPGGIVAAELAIQADAGSYGELESTTDAAPAATPSGIFSAGDFQETLYFLDEQELEVLRAELEREWTRDLRRDILNALFDRLEDGSPARQLRILEILHQLLPTFIMRGDLGTAAALLRELDGLLARPALLGSEAKLEAARLLDELNAPVVLEQLVHALEAADIAPGSSDLAVFLSHLGLPALPLLLRTTELTGVQSLRLRLGAALDRLGTEHPSGLLALLGSADEVVAIGAARVVGRLRLPEAAAGLAGLLSRPSEEARLVAVEALVETRSAAALKALQGVLEDPVREVRLAAARGLGTLRYQPARSRFEEILEGRELRAADLTEKLAFFEAYAALAGADGVPLLERLLTGRGLLGRRQHPEIRACAAAALGRITAPSARAVLERARDEGEPMVRSAITRALRQEAQL